MSIESIETLLKQDFTRLTASLEVDGFAERVLKGLEGRRRFRLVIVCLAGGAGALLAGLQFADLFPAIPAALAHLPLGGVSDALSPQLLAATALALSLAATLVVVQSDR